MTYTPQDLARCQTILDTFRDYLSASPYFDILFTPKVGYLFLRIDKSFLEVDEIENPDKLFEHFVSEITHDVCDLFMCGEHVTVEVYPREIWESRQRLVPYLNRLPEDIRDHYANLVEEYFKRYNGDK